MSADDGRGEDGDDGVTDGAKRSARLRLSPESVALRGSGASGEETERT